MEEIYKACNFYMLRTPLLPVEFYKSICFPCDINLKTEMNEILKTKEIKEAIEVGSTSLFKSLDKYNGDVQSSLMKYLIRLSTRTTPYGLFSGVNIGYFDEKSHVQLNNKESFKKRMRPDMEWVYGVVNNFENDSKYSKYIKVKKNNLIYHKGDRVINSYVSNLGIIDEKDGDVVTSIRSTELFSLISENTHEFIEIEKLGDIISDKYTNVNNEKIYKYINNIMNNEYLISDLRPPLIECKPFEYVINKVKEIDEFGDTYIKLKDIYLKIEKYNNQAIGDGIELYDDIVNSMKKVYSNSSYFLQVDTKISTSKNTLNKCIAKDIEKYCSTLNKLGIPHNENISIKEYKKEFIEKYGENTEVRILELMDEDIGIGAPIGYTNPMSHKSYVEYFPSDKLKKVKDYIKYKIVEANTKKSKVIELTEDDIEKMSSYGDFAKAEELSPSIELNVIISAKDCKNIDEDNYLLFIGPNIGSNKAGKTFGRFMDILAEDDTERIKSEIYEKEQNVLDDEYLMVEINELLQHGRGNNVTINSSNVEYEICIATSHSGKKKSLDIKDLFVGVSNDRLYVKSKTLNKKLFVTYHHMMTYKNGSNLARLLKEITFGYYEGLLDTAFTFEFKDFDYIPRLKYDKVVIMPESWYVKKEMFDLTSYENFEESLTKWLNKNKVPRYVYEKKYDNRLLLDLHSTLHRKELFNIIRKSKETVLLTEIEIGENLDRTIVTDKDLNKYCSEIVIPLIRKPIEKARKDILVLKSIKTKSVISQNKCRVSVQDTKRNLFPGDENWYYYKLYLSSTRSNELIGDYLHDFCQKLIQDGSINKYFFLRYGDPEFHVRLRLQVNEVNDFVIHKYLKGFFEELKSKGLLNLIQNENYFRELERYGGVEIIEDAESYFYADSEYVGALIQYMREGKIDYEKTEIAIMSIISIMEQFNISFEDQENLFSSIIGRNDNRDLYKKNRKEYIRYSNWQAVCNGEIGSEIYDLILKKQEKTINYTRAINKQDELGLLSNSKVDIVLSCIHMFCNRFNGDRSWETLVMSLVRNSLYDLKSFKKSEQKKKQRALDKI